MTPLDALLLILYALIVHRVLTRAIAKLDKRAQVSLNGEQLAADLEARNLKGIVQFGFNFQGTYSLSDTLRKLSIMVMNTSSSTIYVNWDQSSLTNFGERSRRVIRLTPDKSPDLVRPQVWSAIPPNQQLQEEITAEDVLSRQAETDPLELTGVIVPIIPPPVGEAKFYLCLWLVVQQTNLEEGGIQESQYLLPFEFKINKRPWTDALPW